MGPPATPSDTFPCVLLLLLLLLLLVAGHIHMGS
jgi:hypothetical protein